MIDSVLPFFHFLAQTLHPLWYWVIGFSVGVAAIACCYLGINALYCTRLLADLPTSKLRSAAQGYVKLEGYAKMMQGDPIYAPLSGKPCVWYCYKVEFYDDTGGRDGEWTEIESVTSDAIFYLVDQTGECIVDPDGAEVTPTVKLKWKGNHLRPMHSPKQTRFWANFFSRENYRYTESRLHEYDPLYALGYFTGLGERESISINEATRDLLSLWKRDKGSLLQRFDANRDGEIDIDEWEKVRQAAEREVIATWRERQQHPDMNLLKKPTDERPYLLSSESQDQIITRNRLKALWGLLGFLALGLCLVWWVRQRFGF